MKLGPVTKLTRETRQRQKKLTMALYQQIMAASIFFQFMADLD